MNNNHWKEWNKDGFIPGPEETENEFHKRIEFCENLLNNLQQIAGMDLPFECEPYPSQNILEEVFPLTEELYGIQPRWVPLFFSNYQLAPWHGGCAWIFQCNEETPSAAFLQLRSSFLHSSKFLKMYTRKELIAHELAHVGRMLYQEPDFEEFFAYQSSLSRWRRLFGPIVQSSKESFFFILLLGICVFIDFALLFLEGNMAFMGWWFTILLPLGLMMFALGRLFYRHHLLSCCLQKLEKLYSPLQAKHLIYRLQDVEIKHFSKISPSSIRQFIDQAAHNSFRWRFLKTLYPFKAPNVNKENHHF